MILEWSGQFLPDTAGDIPRSLSLSVKQAKTAVPLQRRSGAIRWERAGERGLIVISLSPLALKGYIAPD